MTPEEIKAVIAEFDNGSRRHHHKLVRTLATELLRTKLENVLLKALADVEEVHLTACEEEEAA